MSNDNDGFLNKSYSAKTGFNFNPSNKGFAESIRSKIYVDKSGLISYTNSVINTKQKFICVSRPRRFGKTMAAEMLVAYYSHGCDSTGLFSDLCITNDKSYAEHLNKYNVVFLNISQFLRGSNNIDDILIKVQKKIKSDMSRIYPDLSSSLLQDDLIDVFRELHAVSGIPIIFVIDEWDCLFREYKTDTSVQKGYLDFLRDLLKDQEYVALAYMTGILPIKKYGVHSALNMFDEFSMTNPGKLAEFVGFTHDEVIALCDTYNVDYDEMSRWYNGYNFSKIKLVYNPRSVVRAVLSEEFDNYWTKTETYEALSIYFSMNFDGLKDILIRLLAGEKKKIGIRNFSNDMVTFKTYDDILTLLIHLGYLCYNFETHEVSIPNKEISDEFVAAIKDVDWSEVINAVNASDDLLEATWHSDSKTVAKMVEHIHNETSYLQYNDENALSYVVSLAYFRARDFYEIIREMPAGKGLADLIFLPRKKHTDKPAILIELKWDKSATGALQQIKNKKYHEVLRDYKGNILLVGINYDKKSKKHECEIEKA